MNEIKEKKIAVVGVSRDTDKNGYRIFRDLREAGYQVWGINPSGGMLLNQKIYTSLKDLGFTPDLVITVVPPSITERVVETCRELGVPEIWMQPGSDSPSAVEKARAYGMKVTFNACFMALNGVWK